LNFGLSTDFSVQLWLWLSEKAQQKSKSKSEVAHCFSVFQVTGFQNPSIFPRTILLLGVELLSECCRTDDMSPDVPILGLPPGSVNSEVLELDVFVDCSVPG